MKCIKIENGLEKRSIDKTFPILNIAKEAILRKVRRVQC